MRILRNQGKKVVCEFNADPIPNNVEVLLGNGLNTIKVELTLRHFFQENTAAFAKEMLRPGELSQGLVPPGRTITANVPAIIGPPADRIMSTSSPVPMV